MREIKFRARCKVDSQWYYGCFKPNKTKNEMPLSMFWLQVESGALDIETVGQYPGLKDKNGKEIYEGDIVRACPLWSARKTPHLIKFDSGSFNVPSDAGKEVIGNIWENPELLEVKE